MRQKRSSVCVTCIVGEMESEKSVSSSNKEKLRALRI